mgnify:FL=1
MTDKEFRLEVLRMTLETGSARVQADPIQTADKFLKWCKDEEKPVVEAIPFNEPKPVPKPKTKLKKG